MFTNVILGWIARRVLEIGGLIAAGLTAWNNLPPGAQEAILLVLGGNWQGITLATLVSLWGYAWSYLSTVKPQVVTAEKKQIPLTPTGAAEAEAIAKLAPRPRTLWERLTQR